MPDPVDPVTASAADLPSDVLRRLVLVYSQLAVDEQHGTAVRRWYLSLAQGLRDVQRARERAWRLLEFDLMNDGAGELVAPADVEHACE